jgi:hypothetical protein
MMSASFEHLRDWASDRASDWYRDETGRDRLADPGVPAGDALRIEVFNRLLPLAAEASGVASDFGGGGLVDSLKSSGRDRWVRSIGLRLQSLRRSDPVEPVRIAFVGEFATPSGLEPMQRVASALPPASWRAIAADPRIGARWHGSAPLPATIPWRDERAMIGRASRIARERWAEIRRTPPAIVLDGKDLSGAAMDRLAPLVERSLPWLHVEREAIRRHVERLRPAWLVVASDQHRLGRLSVDVAAASGARSLVLQHGWPQYRIGYVPVVADAVATWSEAAVDWFTDAGASRDRLIVAGNPRLDPLPTIDRVVVRATEAARLGIAGTPAMLLVLSPSDAARNLALVDLALAAVATDPQAVLVVKLHPGDGRWEAVRRRVDEAPVKARVRIQRSEPIGPLLAWADLTLLHRSTVAIESLAAGTPVAIGAVGDESPGDALPEELRLPEVTRSDELRRLAQAVATDETRRAFVAERWPAVLRVTGPLDGRSAERIATHLLADAP